MAFFDTTWYVNFGDGSTTGYYAVARWTASTAYAAGQIVRQRTTPGVGNERCFICIIAATSLSSEPGWSTSRGVKVLESSGPMWQECSGQPALNGDLTNTATWAQVKAATPAVLGQIIKRSNGASYQICTTAGAMSASEPTMSDTAGVTTADTTAVWTSLGPVGNFTGGQAPHARLANAFAANWFASGNTVYVGDNHAETQTTQMTMSPTSALMAKILCHNHSGSYPPVASDITTGATITTSTAATGITFSGQGSFYFYGVTFNANTSGIIVASGGVTQTQNWYFLDNCSLQMAGAGLLAVGATSTAWGIVTFNNTTVKFGSTAAYIIPEFAQFIWQNTGSILASGSSIPTTMFQFPNSVGRFNTITLNNLDLSQLTGSLFTNASNSSIGTLVVQDCKLNAAMTVTQPINTGMNVQLIRSDSAGTSYKSQRIAYEGIETTETSIVRTGGAVDPLGQAQSRKIVTSANAQWLRPYKAEPMVIWNQVTGANVTATVYGTVNAGVLPMNDDIWLECEYLGSATDPLGKIVTTTKTSVLASNAAVPSDSSVWNTPAIAFDPATVGSTTLSNGNLTATHNTSTTNSGVRTSQFNTTGKYYFEATYGAVSNSGDAVGLLLSTGVFGDMVTVGSNCFAVYIGSGNVWSNGSASGKTIGAVSSGNVVGVAVDLTARLGWIRKGAGNWNGDVTANPATGVGGVALQAGSFDVAVGFSVTLNSAWTANFGATSYANAAPSGFGNWSASWSPFKLTATLSSPQPQLAGYLHARVRAAKPSTIYYIDPQINLS